MASASGEGWSKTRVAGSRCPVSADRELRSSIAARESKPRSLKARSVSTVSGPACPSTAATWERTVVSRASARSVAPREAMRSANPDPVSPVAAPRRTGRPARARNTGASSPPWARSADRSRRTGATAGRPVPSARSNRAVPSSADSGTMPPRDMRARSASSRAPVMPPVGAQGPQARERAGMPSAARWAASASRQALAAA